MSKYVKSFTPFYEGGWENQPSENTPIMGEALDAYDSTFVKIEEYLESYEPDIPQGEIPTKVSELENDAGYLTEETVKGVEFPNLVPTSRTIAGIDLADDISVEEMQEALDIYDSTIMDGEIKPWLYSEEEIISGTYRGKPLYKKVLEPIIVTEDMKKYSIEDIQYEYISIDQSMSFVLRNDASFPITNIGYDANSDTVAGGITQHAYITPDKSITFRKGNGITSYTAYITLQYTKTTDAEGSGSDLNPYGIYNAKLDGVKADIEDVKNSIIETIDTTLENSNAGRLLFTEIKGVMEQGENPSPTNPQEIKNSLVSGIKTHGKNFFGFGKTAVDVTEELRPNTVQRLTFSAVDDNPNRVKCNFTGGGYSMGYIAIYGVDGTRDWAISFNVESNTTEYTPSLAKSDAYSDKERLILKFGGGNGGTNVAKDQYFVLSNIQVEEGTVATEYEPYTESSITFSQPIELYGLEDVRDTIENGKVKRRFEKVVFDGSDDEMWTLSSTLAGRYAISLTNEGVKPFGKCLCTQGIMGVNNTQVVNECYLSQYSAFVINTNFATLEEWKAHLQANPMTVVYELAEETTEELPLADQIALNGLETFYGITHVEFISEVKPTFSAKYGTTEMGGMTLESLLTARSNDLRLSAVESAVINNI